MVSAAEVFGYVVGAVALLAIPVAAIKTRWHLPSARISALEDVTHSTEVYYATVVASSLPEAIRTIFDKEIIVYVL